METTTRTNLTSLTVKMLETREVATLSDFRRLVEDLYEDLCNFAKFEAINLEKEVMEEVIKEEVDMVVGDLLEEARALEDSVEEIFEDLPDPHEPMVLEESVEEMLETEETASKAEAEPTQDEILEYRKGDDMNEKKKNYIVSFTCRYDMVWSPAAGL